MAAFSKFYEECLRNKPCTNYFHEGTCLEFFMKAPIGYFKSNMKYFAPIALVPLLVKSKDLSVNTLKKSFLYYLQLIASGCLIAIGIGGTICFIRALFGDFRYILVVASPSLVASIMVFYILPERVRRLFITSVNQCMVECLMKQSKNPLTRTVNNSVLVQTLIFMGCSSTIMQALQDGEYHDFWFLRPSTRLPKDSADKTESQTACMHKVESCTEHLLNGIYTYGILGVTLDVIKAMMSKARGANNFPHKILIKLSNLNLTSTAFLTSYIGIYRFLHCWLRKKYPERNTNHLLATFLAGSCYIFQPKKTILSFAIVQSILILWGKLQKKLEEHKEYKMSKVLRKIPLAKLIFYYSLSMVIAWTTFRPHYVTPFTAKMLNGVTDNFPKRAQSVIIPMELSFNAKLN